MVFEVAGEIFEKEFAERHAESVAQERRRELAVRCASGARRKTPATVGGRYMCMKALAMCVGELAATGRGRSLRYTDSQKWLSHCEQVQTM